MVINMTQSFNTKEIEIQIEVNRALLTANSEENIIKISKLAIDVEIEKNGLPDKTSAKIKIYGLSLNLMEELSALNLKANEVRNHRISLYAGDDSDSLNLIFQGEITRAFANFNNMPDISFELHALTGYFPSLMPAFPMSYKGEIPAFALLSALCLTMGYSFENKGFFGSLRNPILSGSLFEKAMKIAKHIGAELICDNCKFILMPKYTSLSTTAYNLSAENGLIGYPVFDNEGLSIRALHSSNYQLNSLIQLDSIVPRASGLWRIISVRHVLSANNPNNLAWFSYIKTVPYI